MVAANFANTSTTSTRRCAIHPILRFVVALFALLSPLHSRPTHGFIVTTTSSIISTRSNSSNKSNSNNDNSRPFSVSFLKDHMKLYDNNARENEIRKKIMQLKKKGKLKNEGSSTSTSSKANAIDQYADKIQTKMGKSKSKLLSKLKPEFSEAILSSTSTSTTTSNTSSLNSSSSASSQTSTSSSKSDRKELSNYVDDIDDDSIDEFQLDKTEEEMLLKVEEKLLQQRALELEIKRKKDAENNQSALEPDIDDRVIQMEEAIENKRKELQQQQEDKDPETQVQVKKSTSGIGGTWDKNATSEIETYRPANGGWGYFPRPKDISSAYGGGKRIERTSTMEDEARKQDSVNETRDKLKQYREKVGIDVQSEKDHAKEIEEALAVGKLAMQRGVYNAAVTALEKVTMYCSTNSQVGSQVFLELAMAYEAVGRTSEAIEVYSTLSYSRMEDVKYNAQRLLYGIESMKFMRDEMKSEAFSRKKVKQTFIETTGLANIGQNFDAKIYNTAYIDLDKGGGFYRKLTQSVVRSIREARQILLAATDSGEVDRIKVIQALRYIERKFNEALKEEQKLKKLKEEPVAMMNGKPITRAEDLESPSATGMETFNLGDLEQTLENVSGEWKLQLMADSKGDGVNYFNKTLSWQCFDTNDMNYHASGPAGFLSLSQSGQFEVDETSRIITRKEVKSSGSGSFLVDLLGTSNMSGSMAALNLAQQIISVDSEMLITRAVIGKKSSSDTLKDHFSVWRRAEPGQYSGTKQ